MPLAALGNVVDKSRRQWRVHAVQAQQTRAHRRRVQRLIGIGFDGFQFTGGKSHAGVGAKPYRVIRRMVGASQWRVIRQCLFEQLAEAIQIGLGHPPVQRLE
ncbi:hypothetical protein D3C78_1726800 [compost metagenome]